MVFQLMKHRVGQTALLVGGGIGVPPLYELSKRLGGKGVKVIHVLGFQTKACCILRTRIFRTWETYIATVDGTYGTKGFVTDVMINEQLNFDMSLCHADQLRC